MLSFLFYISIIEHGRTHRKLFKAFPLISEGVTYLSSSQKPCQIPTQAFHTVCERDGKWLQGSLVGITVMYSPSWSHMVSSLDFATKWTPEEEPQFNVLTLWHLLLLMFLLKRDWSQFCVDSTHLYEKVTKLLMGDCLTFNSVLRFTNSLHQLVDCSWNDSWH